MKAWPGTTIVNAALEIDTKTSQRKRPSPGNGWAFAAGPSCLMLSRTAAGAVFDQGNHLLVESGSAKSMFSLRLYWIVARQCPANDIKKI
jgi:hypothetical protein